MDTDRILRAGRVAWSLVGMALVFAIVALIAWEVRVIWAPLILSGAVVFLLNPIVTALQHRHIPRAAGAALTYLGVLGLIVLAGLLVFPLASKQADQFSNQADDVQVKVERWVDDRAEQTESSIVRTPTVDELRKSFGETNPSLTKRFKQVREIGAQIFHGLLIAVLTPIIAFYMLVDLPRLREVSTELVPHGIRDEALVVAGRLNRAIGGFFRGQLMVAVIVGTMVSVGLAVIGLPFWLLVGMVAGLFNMIPLIGPWVGGVPGVIIALTTQEPITALWVVLIMAGAQQIDNHLISPLVMQRAVHLHPVIVMMALLAGGTLGGFFGLLLAVPTAAVLKILVGHLWRTVVLGEPPVPSELKAMAEDAQAAPG